MAKKGQTPAAAGDGSRLTKCSWLTVIIAIIVLIAYFVFIGFLISDRNADDKVWSRMAWLFTSVEALAFGAAGVLFGSSIQRKRAEKAETSAEKNSTAAARGEALAATIKADEPDSASGKAVIELLEADEARKAASAVAKRHAEIARQLFPD
ncbi:hypothetical protein ACFLU6_04545 [Acidobacteriota bacterium]